MYPCRTRISRTLARSNRGENGAKEAAMSGTALQEILQQINEVTMQVSRIATAAEEQTATTSGISSNIHQMTEVVEQAARGAQDTSQAASELARLADDLKGIVGKFTLTELRGAV